MKRTALIFAAVLALAPAARAQDAQFPNFDVKAICATRQDQANCAYLQYMDRDKAVPLWLKVSSAVRQECAQWDYATMLRCLQSHQRDSELR